MNRGRAPAISVIMPAYNGAAWIGETIESVIAQTFTDWELVIVDDRSTDDTLEAIHAYEQDPRIVVIEAEANGGPVVARNMAHAAARGRYLVGLDQDDLCKPGRFAAQAAYLDAHPECALVATVAEQYEEGRISFWPGEHPLSPAAIDWLLWVRNPLVWSTVMIRAEAAAKLDPFERPQVRYAEDFDLYRRIRAHGTIARLDESHLLYRCHPGGASQRFREMMGASAAQVLAERYAPLFGEAAHANAELAVRHFMARDPVPDLATLAHLSAMLGTIHAHHRATHDLNAEDRTAVEAEYSRLWWDIARPPLRQGRLGMREAMAVCPPGVRMPANDVDRVLTPLIGRVRALGRGIRNAI